MTFINPSSFYLCVMENNHESGTATLGTQIFKYRQRDMFDTPQAADYEHGLTADMEKRFNEIYNIYKRAGYRITTLKTEDNKVCEGTRQFIQRTKSFSVCDVPLKCMKGKRVKRLNIFLWINL